MAKKKSRYSPQAGALRKKEEARKLAARQATYQAKKKDIWTTVIIVLAAILVLMIAFDFFYAPAGSMRVFMGQLMGVEENAIVKQMENKRFYTFGWMETPEGYTPEEFITTTQPRDDQDFYYVADDASRAVKNVYIAGVSDKGPEEMIELVSSYALYDELLTPETATIAGHELHYFYAKDVSESEGTIGQAYASLVMYTDAVQNSSILINCGTAYFDSIEDVPTKEAMLAEIEPILTNLTVAK